ncbi:hypothetical protein F4802DRAFT_471512 [Xylaria palmicola]|nr:hypothetical protein F4802DRAFT_471512 [Xylaria palmicola]
MDPLSVTASIAGIVTLVNAVFRGVYKYYQTASNTSKEIKELVDQLRSFAGILYSLQLLASALEQSGTCAALRMNHILDATELLAEIQARLNKPITKVGGSKVDQIQQSLKWPFTKSRTRELSDNLVQQQQIICLALQADSLDNLVRLLSNDKDIKKQLSSVQAGVENLQMLTRVEVTAERQRILDFFLKVNPQSNLDTSRKLRHPGTGTWLLETPQFQQWIETAGSKMWLSGIPGAGKTVLAGAMIQKALEKGKNSPKVGVAFFFCDYKDEKATVLSNILGAMASQLARQNDKACNEVKMLYESLHPSNGLTRDLDSDLLQDCLEKMFKYFDQVILVVDGLDECGDRTVEVTEALVNIADYSTNVTMALASRDEYNIDSKLRDNFSKISVDARKEDILLYVASEINRRVEKGILRTSNVSIQDEILTRLSQDACGMFRWVTCQLDYICQCPTDADRRVALKELPPTLDATYERMLRRIHDGHPRSRNIVQKCLQLLALKMYQLDIDDLCHAISVPDTPNATLDESAVVTEADISFLCSSFIRKPDDGRRFEFSHFTVHEYLGREALLKDHDLAGYYLSEPICCATFCHQNLRYLQLRNFYHMPDLDNGDQIQRVVQRRQKHPFYSQAAARWVLALRRAPEDPCCLELAKRLFDPRKSPSFISWAVELLDLQMDFSINPESGSKTLPRAFSIVLDSAFRPLHLAAMLDLPEICEHLLALDPNGNTISMIGSPLECSIGRLFCSSGSLNEALRIDRGIPVVGTLGYATHRQGQATAMLRAAGCVMQDPPKQLGQWSLMEGAIFSAIASLDFSPVSSLIAMCWIISEREATTFENAMALILQGYPSSYPTEPHTHHNQLTASFGNLITELNTFRVFENEPGLRTCAAAWNTAVKLECDFTKDTQLMDTRITLSLDALIRQCEVAISNDDEENMHRYLEDARVTGPSIDHDGTKGCGYSLLRRAIAHGSLKVVRLLNNRGYSLTTPFLDGSLPIHSASRCGEDIISLLLESGASHLHCNRNGDTIWHIAAARFQHSTLSALLKLVGEEKVIALQMQNRKGFTPLTLAIHLSTFVINDSKYPKKYQDATAAIRLLLDACERDTLCLRCVESPWHLAARSGSITVLVILPTIKLNKVDPPLTGHPLAGHLFLD